MKIFLIALAAFAQSDVYIKNTKLRQANALLKQVLKELSVGDASHEISNYHEAAVGQESDLWKLKHEGKCKKKHRKTEGCKTVTEDEVNYCMCYDCPSERMLYNMDTWEIEGCCPVRTAFHWDGSCKALACEDVENWTNKRGKTCADAYDSLKSNGKTCSSTSLLENCCESCSMLESSQEPESPDSNSECEDIPVMDGSSTCGLLHGMLGDVCDFDYGAPGGPCSCMCPSSTKCENIPVMDGSSTCGLMHEMLGDICDFDYGAPDGPCDCMCPKKAETVDAESTEEESMEDEAEFDCAGFDCVACLDDTNYQCVIYDGECLSASQLEDPNAYDAKKFIWMSSDCQSSQAPESAEEESKDLCSSDTLSEFDRALKSDDTGACEESLTNEDMVCPCIAALGKDVWEQLLTFDCKFRPEYDGTIAGLTGSCLEESATEEESKQQQTKEDEAEFDCAGFDCVACLDDTDYQCAFYDGECVSSSALEDPSMYDTKKFTWMSTDCQSSKDPQSKGEESKDERKACCDKPRQDFGFCTMDDLLPESVPVCGKCLYDEQCENFAEALAEAEPGYATGLVYCCPDAKRCLDRRATEENPRGIGCPSGEETADCGYGRSGACSARLASDSSYPQICTGCANADWFLSWMDDLTCSE